MKEKKARKFRFPLWAKSLTVLVFSVVVVSIVAIVFSDYSIRSFTRSHYLDHSVEIADTLALYLDVEDIKTVKQETLEKYNQIDDAKKVENSDWGSQEWTDYVEEFRYITELDAYKRLFKQLSDFHSKNDAKFTYIAFADLDKQRLVYLVDDSPEEERCLPGCFDDFTEQDKATVDPLENGFAPEISNMPEYGHLASVGRPIKDGKDTVAFAIVDLSMDDIVAKENQYVTTLTIILVSISVVTVVIGYVLVLLLLVRPIRLLTKSANEYVKGSNENLNKFSKINIKTKDEIEDLSNSMKKMESDINHYIDDLLSTTTALASSEKKAEELKYYADRDALTGLMNKRAYFEDEIRLNMDIQKGRAKFAISMIDLNDLKVTNDTLGHEKGDHIIVALANIIKDVFKKSSIYRIGGDEFAVISEKEDYKNIQQLEKDFINKIAEAKRSEDPEKRVSAAIGVAFYNSKIDNNVEDTFKRADAEMYKSKKAMKEYN